MLSKRSCSHAAQFIGAKPSHAPTQSIARRRQTIPPVGAHTSKPSLQAHAPTSEAPRNRTIQSARTPKQIRNLLSRRASSKRFPATITASSSQAFTCAETDTIEPARIEESRCPRDARSRSRGARQAWAQRERQRGRIQLKRLIQHGTPYSHRLLSRKRRPRRGRQRRPPPTARPRRCGPDAGCEGSPQEAAALQSRRRWNHLGGR